MKTVNRLGFIDPQYFNLIWQQNPVALAEVALDGSIITVNGAFSKMLGYAEAELESMKFQDITDPRDFDAYLESIRRLVAHEIDSYSMIKRYITKQGKAVWAKLHVAPVLNTRGYVDHFIATVLELPNHGNYKVEHRDQEIVVRPSLTVGQFVADNWKWFLGAFTTLLMLGAPVIWKAALFVEKIKKTTGVEW